MSNVKKDTALDQKIHYRVTNSDTNLAVVVFKIEKAMETLSTLTAEVKSALEHVIQISSEEKVDKHEKHKKGQVAEVLGKSLRNVMYANILCVIIKEFLFNYYKCSILAKVLYWHP